MKQLIIFLLFVHVAIITRAQKQDNVWIFGDSCGISFQTGIPQLLSSVRINSVECSSSIADSLGNLLFYAGAENNNFDSLKI